MTQYKEEVYAPNRENVFSSLRSFSIPVELLEKAELVAYARILENVLKRLHEDHNRRDNDWQLSCTSGRPTDKVSCTRAAESSLRNPRFDANCSRNLKDTFNGKVKKKLPCKYFSAGYCKYEDACWYVHQRIEKGRKEIKVQEI